MIGLVLRLILARQDLFADEISTYWIVSTNPLAGVIASVRSHFEITPPLSFVVEWLTSRVDPAPAWLRAGSVFAGTAIIPATYAVGARTAGRPAGLVAAAITALAPFMAYYSGEARSYALLMALVLLSTLSLLCAVDRRSAWAWSAYALSTCAAVYTHYTCVFVLGVQLAWLWWTHPEARRPALVANLAAVVGFLPWLPGLLADLRSPTLAVLGFLQPFNVERVRIALGHWSVGHPCDAVVALRDVPGIPALALLAAGVSISAVAVAVRRRPHALRVAPASDHRVLLLVALALATPLGAALQSAIGPTTMFSTRNLAASWPAFALALATLTVAAGPRLRILTTALVVASFGIGATKLLDTRYERPHYAEVARHLEGVVAPGDVVIDETVVPSPGPLSHLDLVLRRELHLVRSGGPAVRERPFTILDPVVSPEEAAREAAAAARGGRIFLVTYLQGVAGHAAPDGYRLVEQRLWPGFLTIAVLVYEPAAPTSSRG